MVKITDIDWSNVRMDPMAGSGYPPCERNAVYSEKAPVRKTAIVLRRVLNITIWAILLIGGIVLVIQGYKVFIGNVEPPEFTYEQVMGLMVILFGIFLLRFKVRV